MKVIKFYCDHCNREIENKSEIYKYPTLDIMQYVNNEVIEVTQNDICIDCLHKLTKRYIGDIKFK